MMEKCCDCITWLKENAQPFVTGLDDVSAVCNLIKSLNAVNYIYKRQMERDKLELVPAQHELCGILWRKLGLNHDDRRLFALRTLISRKISTTVCLHLSN